MISFHPYCMLIVCTSQEKKNAYYLLSPTNFSLSLCFIGGACIMLLFVCSNQEFDFHPLVLAGIFTLVFLIFFISLSFSMLSCIMIYIICAFYLEDVDHRVPLGVFLILASIALLIFFSLYLIFLWNNQPKKSEEVLDDGEP